MTTTPPWVRALGKLIADMRAEMMWSQDELGRRAGVAPKTISNMERGRKDGNGYTPFPSSIKQVLAAFGPPVLDRLRENKHLARFAPAVEERIREQELHRIARQLIEQGTLPDWPGQDG